VKVERFAENPLITPADVPPTREDFEVACVFNPGVIRFGGETLLLMRVAERPKATDQRVVRVPILDCGSGAPAVEIHEFSRDDPTADFRDARVVSVSGRVYLTSISHLRLARSRDGHSFAVDEKPTIVPDRPAEAYGIEDPRITELDGVYYITYKSVSSHGITQGLATTRDFQTFQKHGIILPPENMDAMIFPARIGNRYAALHRPFPCLIGEPSIWVAYSEDGLHWGDHRFLAGESPGGWESGRIGGGAVPFMTQRGWLEIYHGATPDNHYSLGAMLLDADKPDRVIARSSQPIMEPEAAYEVSGFVPNVVFTCGAIVDGDRLTIYYGAADTVIAGAEVSVSQILADLDR
jgi:predicted GH43/DUF377 family glycosyl hydrolase